MKNIIFSLLALFIFGGCAVSEQPKNCFDKTRLEQREYDALKNARASLATFKTEYGEMSSYINFLNAYTAEYSKYISAASTASLVIKYMPIPYAGQISSSAAFGTKMTALASNASKSVLKLNTSAAEFDSKLAAYETTKNSQKLQEARKYASTVLQNDLEEAKLSLIRLKDGAAGLIAVSMAISQYYSSGDQLLSKATSMFSDKSENDKRAQSDNALKAKTEGFDKRLTKVTASFEGIKGHIKSADTYGALSDEL